MTGLHRTPRPGLFARTIDRLAGIPIHWTGVDRYGIEKTGGKKVVSVAVFIEDLYAKRWRYLTVTDALGQPLGGIESDDATGRREWWVGDPS